MYEIEIKTLLGTRENVHTLLQNMSKLDPTYTHIGTQTQLNHYFVGDVSRLYTTCQEYLPADEKVKLQDVLENYKNHSVRTRYIAPDTTILVVKASIDDTTSTNGKIRKEYEYILPGMSLYTLDDILLSAGLAYQAKWSRTRESYQMQDMVVAVDKNAGYGYIAEFEKVVPTAENAQQVRDDILHIMHILGVEELSQDRLARMFDFYNANWSTYYGTEDIFVVE
jgi:adenylate cyclase class IV